MSDLRRRFGRLLAAHRRRAGLTQQALAEAVDASVFMISKLESGASGTSFAMIERLSQALGVDPAELFAADLTGTRLQTAAYDRIIGILVELDESQLEWLEALINAAVEGRPRGR